VLNYKSARAKHYFSLSVSFFFKKSCLKVIKDWL